MNKQRKVLITVTYNEMGIIIDTKAEEVAQPNLQPTCNQLATDCISRQEAIDAVKHAWAKGLEPTQYLEELPPAQPERKKGRWISVPHKLARICSCCEHDEPYKFADDDAPIYNFCPHCGVDMREDGEKV